MVPNLGSIKRPRCRVKRFDSTEVEQGLMRKMGSQIWLPIFCFLKKVDGARQPLCLAIKRVYLVIAVQLAV